MKIDAIVTFLSKASPVSSSGSPPHLLPTALVGFGTWLDLTVSKSIQVRFPNSLYTRGKLGEQDHGVTSIFFHSTTVSQRLRVSPVSLPAKTKTSMRKLSERRDYTSKAASHNSTRMGLFCSLGEPCFVFGGIKA